MGSGGSTRHGERHVVGHGASSPDMSLRHVAVVGGSVGEWEQLDAEHWRMRLIELGKVADQVGASWLTLRPYGLGPTTSTAPSARRAETVGGCDVVAATLLDGRRRLIDAMVAVQRRDGWISEASITAELNAPALVDPDLVVVLGPADHCPPSLVWELAYSELVFVDVPWVQFQPHHLEAAIDAFTHRHRRFGGLD